MQEKKRSYLSEHFLFSRTLAVPHLIEKSISLHSYLTLKLKLVLMSSPFISFPFSEIRLTLKNSTHIEASTLLIKNKENQTYIKHNAEEENMNMNMNMNMGSDNAVYGMKKNSSRHIEWIDAPLQYDHNTQEDQQQSQCLPSQQQPLIFYSHYITDLLFCEFYQHTSTANPALPLGKRVAYAFIQFFNQGFNNNTLSVPIYATSTNQIIGYFAYSLQAKNDISVAPSADNGKWLRIFKDMSNNLPPILNFNPKKAQKNNFFFDEEISAKEQISTLPQNSPHIGIMTFRISQVINYERVLDVIQKFQGKAKIVLFLKGTIISF